MKNKTKTIILTVITILSIILNSIFISLDLFGIANPLVSLSGLFQVSFTDAKYVELQKYPRIIIAKPSPNPDGLLTEYMRSKGYSLNEEGRLGSIHEFKQDEKKEYVDFSANSYYSLWKWLE